MTQIHLFVTDEAGNPLSGVQVHGRSWCSPFGGGNMYGTTGSDGKITLDTGCILGGQASVTLSANGYKSQVEKFNLPTGGGDLYRNVSMIKIIAPTPTKSGTEQCPEGYILSGNSCIEKPKAHVSLKFYEFFKKNWLVFFVLIGIGILIYVIVKKPSLLRSGMHEGFKAISKIRR